MTTIILVIHTIIAVLLVGIVLLQKSEGGGLGLGGGSVSGFLSARGSANFLTRTTAWLATLFFITSLTLVVLSANNKRLDIVPPTPSSFIPPVNNIVPTAPIPAVPEPSVPVGQ